MVPPQIFKAGMPVRSTLWHSVAWSRSAILVGSIIILLSVLILTRFSFFEPDRVDSPRTGAPTEIDRRMHDCIRNVLEVVGETRPQLWFYKDVWNVCAHEVFSVDSLVDFDIRREKLLKEEFDERVLLWMVVAVTISGVVLAGLQLLSSYRLASAGLGGSSEASELSLASNRLAIKSSVTGLIILGFSLAFFVLYVKWIYPPHDIAIAGPDVKEIPSGIIQGDGQLEPPPSTKPPDTDAATAKEPPIGTAPSQAQEPTPRTDAGRSPRHGGSPATAERKR